MSGTSSTPLPAPINTVIASGGQSIYRLAVDQYNDPLDFIAIMQANNLITPFIVQPQSIIIPPTPTTDNNGNPTQSSASGTGIQQAVISYPYIISTINGVTTYSFNNGEICSSTTGIGKVDTSIDGTIISVGSDDVLIDQRHNYWSIVNVTTITIPATLTTLAITLQVGQVAVNGIIDSSTSNVVEMTYVAGVIYYEDDTGLWYSSTSPFSMWSTGTFDSPLLAIGPPVVIVPISVLPGAVFPYTSNITPTGLSVYWTAPTGTQPIYYQVQYQLSGGAWQNVGSSSIATSVQITNLSPNQIYNLQVLDFNALGTSIITPNVITFQTAYGATAPGPVTPTIGNITTNSIVIGWSQPTGTAPFTYQVYYRIDGTSSWNILSSVTALNEGVLNLNTNTPYDFQVIATNSVGSSTSTVIVKATTLSAAVGSVGTPIFSNLSQTTLTVSWNVPSGNPPFNYELQNRITGTTVWSTIVYTNATTFNVTNLLSQTEYDFQIIPSDSTSTSIITPTIASVQTTATITNTTSFFVAAAIGSSSCSPNLTNQIPLAAVLVSSSSATANFTDIIELAANAVVTSSGSLSLMTKIILNANAVATSSAAFIIYPSAGNFIISRDGNQIIMRDGNNLVTGSP